MMMERSARRLLALLQKQPILLDVIRRVWRFTRPRYTAGAVAVIFNPAGEVLLVEHVFHAYTPWGLPGGYIDRREDPEVGLIRELREELQLDAAVEAIVTLDRHYGNHLDLVYLCHARGEIGKLSMELKTYCWCNPAHLPELPAYQSRAITAAAARWQSSNEQARTAL